MDYIERSLEPVLRRAISEFPAVVLTGPRQSGKTTLLKHLFGATHGYVSLELPDVRASATADPRSFLEAHRPPVIFDEIQYAADLLPYIKERIDERRDIPGQYLISGSQNLLMLERVTESLAGRAAVLRLLPLSQREIAGEPQRPLPWERDREATARPIAEAYAGLWPSLLRGGYPELVKNPGRDVFRWHASYVHTYLERDVRTLRRLGDLGPFQDFLRVVAARSGQLLNRTDVGRDLGLATNTVKAWLSVLEASYQAVVVRPYFANVGKRMVKQPKVYLTDPGILCYLVDLRDAGHAAAGPLAGTIFETAVFCELTRTLTHRGEDPRIYFWRTSTKQEVDFLVEQEGRLIPIEVKLSATPNPRMATGLRRLRADLGDRVGGGYVIHPGDVMLPLGDGDVALPFAML